MLFRRPLPFWIFTVVTTLTFPASAQSVISTHSGIVNYFEGSVFIDTQTLVVLPGKFYDVPQGAELRTADGYAEILLTPTVFLRLGKSSAIRMDANDLSNTRVELLGGSAIVDSGEPVAGTSVTLIYKDWRVHFLEEGVYRVEADPPRMWVLDGKAEVFGGDAGAVLAEPGIFLPLATVLVPDRTVSPPIDALSAWADGRQQSVSADNAIAANIQDPGSIDNSTSDVGGITYFPPLYLPPPGWVVTSLYGVQDPMQPGFSSVYLPGYTYLPLFFGLRPVGSPPVRQPVFVGGHFPTHPPVRNSIAIRPMTVLPTTGAPLRVPMASGHPVSSVPAPVRSAPPTGVHPAGHR
jgi:hypothetical protein